MAKGNSDRAWKPIKLSAAVFGHISQGLYRSPAGAIKELISNSFDADAPLVRIHTDFPRFETFSCEDTGQGLEKAEFLRLMERGIGTSYKRAGDDVTTPVYKRPVIGRLGIGILALAQICSEFSIVSHHKKTKTAFRASIRFPPYTKQEIEKILKRRRQTSDNETFVQGGEYASEDIDFDEDKCGARIFTNYLRETFRKRMRNLSSYARKLHFDKTGPYKDFEEFLTSVYGADRRNPSLSRHSDYDQLLFGLALAAPLPYVEGGDGNIALSTPLVKQYQRALKGYRFRVEVDNILLARPLYLPSDRQHHTAESCSVLDPIDKQVDVTDGLSKERVRVSLYPIKVRGEDLQFRLYEFKYLNQNVAGRPLGFSGYVFQQTGRLYPREIQGSLVRIRNVAIGSYDPGIMAYPLAEGPRYSMVSLEIFVEQGFEDALNIDRDSFNQLDAHYIRMQSFVYNLLHQQVFPETWGEEKERNKRKKEVKAVEGERVFLSGFRAATQERYARLVRSEKPRHVKPDGDVPVRFRRSAKRIEIDSWHPVVKPVLSRRRYRTLAERVVIAFERAELETDANRRRQVFYQLLRSIFSTV
jgi:hypothetical protein